MTVIIPQLTQIQEFTVTGMSVRTKMKKSLILKRQDCLNYGNNSLIQTSEHNKKSRFMAYTTIMSPTHQGTIQSPRE